MKISLVIVTRNRADKLSRCLLSLSKQTVKLNEVIVVDNNSVDKTKKIVASYTDRLLIKYFLEKKVGIPYARNRGLKEVGGEIIAFTDDDCVLDENWVKEIIKIFKQNKDIGFVVGKSSEKKINNLFSTVTIANHNRWFFRMIDKKGKVKNGGCFDTKNVAVRKSVVGKHNLKFNPVFSKYSCGEDTDFGKSLVDLRVGGVYNPKMKVKHGEPDNLKSFLDQAFRRGRANQLNRQKWVIKKEKRVNPSSRWAKWRRDYSMFSDQPLVVRIICFFLFKLYIRVSMIGKWYERQK